MIVIASWLLYRYVAPKGWREVYVARREEGRLAREGLYGVVRHPQYVGIFLAVFGQLVHWPTIPTLGLPPTPGQWRRLFQEVRWARPKDAGSSA